MHFPPALLPTIFALPLASAHFLLQYPATAGFNDNQEGTAPCGSFTPFTPGSANITDFHVGGDAVAVTSTHPAALWLFRAALGTDMAAANWTQLVPTVGQTGLGNFCERQLVAPASWAGQKGIVQVVQDNAADGVLYQCAAVNFVSGTISPPSQCQNGSGVSASYAPDPTLATILGTATGMAATSVAASSGSAAATAATTSAAAKSGAESLKVDTGMLGSVLLAGVIGVGTIAVRAW